MSAVQTYRTTDRLIVDVQEPWDDLPNLADHLNGTTHGWWGHLGQTTLSYVTGLRLTAGTGPIAVEARADLQEITPSVAGRYMRVVAKRGAGTAGKTLAVGIIQHTSGGATITSTGATTTSAVGGTAALAATAVDPSTVSLQVFARGTAGLTAGQYVEVVDFAVVVGDSLAAVNAATMQLERGRVNFTGSVAEVTIERDELQVGSLSVTLVDAGLDPATVDVLRPGREVRALALTGAGWGSLIVAKILDARTTYDLKTPGIPDNKRSRIVLTATDDVSLLANTPRAEGVATIDELPYVLAGCGVPWIVNGSIAGVPASDVTVVSVVEAASAVDQVAITRDTARGYAWLDRRGTLQVWDAASIPTTIADVLDESTYSDAEIDFDTQRSLNTVTVKLLTIDPDTGDTVETSHGPFVDAEAARVWRARTAEFTVHGIDADDVDDYAAGILAAAATPVKRVNSLTLPLRTAAEHADHVLLDLYDLVTVENARAGISEDLRVVSVKHRITAGRDRGSNRWFVDVGFAGEGTVAPPQVTPSPETPTALTLAQRLRPVGEVTTLYGLASQVWSGWLVMDGTPFNVADFPDFAAWLGPLIAAGGHPAFVGGVGVLPNATDRVLVGAGTKAPGSTGGAFSRVLAVGNLPPHTHTIAHTHDMTHTHQIGRGTAVGTSATSVAQGNATAAGATSTGASSQANTGASSAANSGNGPGTSDPVDTTPKYLAAFHVIRVK